MQNSITHYNGNYLDQVIFGQGDPRIWHGLFADTLWETATLIPPDSPVVIKFPCNVPSMLAFNIDKLKDEYESTVRKSLRENYTPFNQCLGIDFTLTFNKSLNSNDRSFYYNSICYLWEQLSFYNPNNGLRINSFPDASIYYKSPVKRPFNFDPKNPLTLKKVSQLLTFEKLANSKLIARNPTSFQPLR